MSVLYLTCGLPGSGKTQLAKIIEREAPALRLTGDDWMHKLYPGISTPEAETGPCRGRVEMVQWEVAQRTVTLGCNVVVDWGVWSRTERDTLRQEVRTLGAQIVLCFLDASFEKLWQRISRRNAALPAGTFDISRSDLLRWSKLFEPPTIEEMALFDPPSRWLAAHLRNH